jgi:16S rRNA G966 N2-methylase RsmD
MGQYTNTIVDIADCLVCAPPIRQVFPWLRQELLPRLAAEGAELDTITIIVGDDPPPVLRLQPRRPVPRGLRRAVSDGAAFPLEWDGEGKTPRTVTLTVGGLACAVDTATFFQAHPAAVAELLADPALDLMEDAGMLELYCGSGLFSLHFARRTRSVLGVEGDRGCRRLFTENMRRHQVANARLEPASIEAWLARHSGELGNFDTLFVDPPRTGLTPPVRKSLAQAPFRHRLYLSCDVATQHRDLDEWLAAGRCRLEGLTVFDFFPNTFHIECLARLHGSD